MEDFLKTFLVIGGGASGVIVAYRLLQHPTVGKVTLFEPGDLAAGVAYGTKHLGHLLNVSAGRMNALGEDDMHFLRWLEGQSVWKNQDGWTAGDYVPRRIYRDYLQSLIAPYKSDPRFEWVKAKVAHLTETRDKVTATTTTGFVCEAEAAVLATGNEAPDLPKVGWRHVGWSNDPLPDVAEDAPVLIIGTGLSMVDAVISLLDGGHKGQMTAVSRRGLIPQAHDTPKALTLQQEALPADKCLSDALHWFRQEVLKGRAEGYDWRSLVDGLRPHTQGWWQSLSLSSKKRFLRHLRPWWDVHRHRMAPEIAARIHAACSRGQLRIVSGRISSIDGADHGATIRILPRGSRNAQTFKAALVIECRGASADISRTKNPLLIDLEKSGLISPSETGIGAAVSPDGALISSDGTISKRLFCVGPLTAGQFWEIVAIPDIRVQVRDLATRLTSS